MGPNSRRKRLMGEINVVPLIDVMLVLLVIFMATAPLLTQGIKVDLPKSASQPLVSKQSQPPMIVSLDKNGRIYLNRGPNPEAAVTPAQLGTAVRSALQQSPQVEFLLRADTTVAYGEVVSIMVEMQGAGARKIGFLTDPTDVRVGSRR